MPLTQHEHWQINLLSNFLLKFRVQSEFTEYAVPAAKCSPAPFSDVHFSLSEILQLQNSCSRSERACWGFLEVSCRDSWEDTNQREGNSTRTEYILTENLLVSAMRTYVRLPGMHCAVLTSVRRLSEQFSCTNKLLCSTLIVNWFHSISSCQH